MPMNMHDPHRIDDPHGRYRTPAERMAESTGAQPIPMTVGGLNAVQSAARAAALARQAGASKTTDDAIVGQIFELAKAVRTAQQSHIDNVERQRESLRLPPEVAMAECRKFAESETAKSLSTAREVLDSWVDTKAAAAQQIRDDLIQPGDSATELRRQRKWDQVKHAIDTAQADPSGSSTITAARRAIQGADDETLGVVIDQVPAYLEALGLPTEFLDAEISHRVPELAAVQRDLANAQRDSAVCRHDLAAVGRGITSGIPVATAALVDPSVVANRVGDPAASAR